MAACLWCVTPDNHSDALVRCFWCPLKQTKLNGWPCLYFAIKSLLLSLLNICWALLPIYPLCRVSYYLSLSWSTEGLPSLSVQKQTPLISGVARSCSSLTTLETFSHVHIRLILNVQQHCFFVCCKMAPWMQSDLKDNPVVLRRLVDDTPANRTQSVSLVDQRTLRMDGPKECV